jgi:lactoylglutathione lyase
MIAVDKISLNVRDQDAAKRFWTEQMGFEEIDDQPMNGPGSLRWIEVRAPGDAVELVLYTTQFDPDQVGRLGTVMFTCDDINEAYEVLTARGVECPDAPSKQDWGWWATFKDNEGNLYGLGQRRGS